MSLANYSNAELKLALIVGTVPARKYAANDVEFDLVQLPVSRAELEAELSKRLLEGQQ